MPWNTSWSISASPIFIISYPCMDGYQKSQISGQQFRADMLFGGEPDYHTEKPRRLLAQNNFMV